MKVDLAAMRRGSREWIADQIRADIMRGDLKFGQRVPESDYVKRFGVSRTPVREAILTLSSEGLVRIQPQSGSWVIRFSEESMRKLFSARLTLELAGVKNASPAARMVLVAKLKALSPDLYRKVSTEADYDAFNDVDTEFHRLLVAASENDFLLKAYLPVMVCSMAARSRLEKRPLVSDRANDDHERILSALADDDLPRFEAALKEHLDWVLDLLLKVTEITNGDTGD